MRTKAKKSNNFNRKTYHFICDYFHDGGWWALTIDAYNFKDAEARSKKLGLQLKGKIMAKIPAKLGFFAKLLCFIKNLTQTKG